MNSKSQNTFSPLLRQLERPANQAEADMIAKIVERNTINAGYKTVRVFTKQVDARLIKAITHLTGKSIDSRSTLRANYEIDEGRIYVNNIIKDGVPYSGRILLAEGEC